MPIFGGDKPSLSELQEKEEYIKQQVSIEKQKVLLAKLKKIGGKKEWFTTEHGVDWGALAAHVRGFFGGDD
jgi:hypothetical protein